MMMGTVADALFRACKEKGLPMPSSTLQRIELEARTFGLNKIQAHGAVTWVVVCKVCKKEHRARWSPSTPPEAMVKSLRAKGWQIGNGHDPVCNCVKNRRQKMGASELRNGTALTVVGSDPKSQTQAKLNRAIFGLLEDHFDDEKRLYREGWSDARVAKETGASESFVTSTRAMAFGDLAEDPKITALRDDIQLATMELDDCRKRLDGLASRVDKLAGKI